MTLEQFISKYSGKKVGDGQCGSLVRQYWIEVDQTNPPSYINSKDYWFNPVPGYDKVSSPQPGDIAIYNGHGAFPEGHSAIVVNGTQVFEQNADPDGSPAHLYNRSNTYLLGYLHKQGGQDMPTLVNEGNLNVITSINNRQPNDGDKGYIGRDFEQVVREFIASGEHKAIMAQYDRANELEKELAAEAIVLAPGKYRAN